MLTLLPKQAFAATKIAGASAAFISDTVEEKIDYRSQILEKYLQKYNSPLTPYARNFVLEADKNNIDWKLLVAISGVESTFGKQVPANSYNGWGWGIFGSQTKYFTSWDDAIATISKGIRVDYMNKWGAKDIYSIGRIYAASPTWANRVTYFSEDIETFGETYTNSQLSISI